MSTSIALKAEIRNAVPDTVRSFHSQGLLTVDPMLARGVDHCQHVFDRCLLGNLVVACTSKVPAAWYDDLQHLASLLANETGCAIIEPNAIESVEQIFVTDFGDCSTDHLFVFLEGTSSRTGKVMDTISSTKGRMPYVRKSFAIKAPIIGVTELMGCTGRKKRHRRFLIHSKAQDD